VSGGMHIVLGIQNKRYYSNELKDQSLLHKKPKDTCDSYLSTSANKNCQFSQSDQQLTEKYAYVPKQFHSPDPYIEKDPKPMHFCWCGCNK